MRHALAGLALLVVLTGCAALPWAIEAATVLDAALDCRTLAKGVAADLLVADTPADPVRAAKAAVLRDLLAAQCATPDQ